MAGAAGTWRSGGGGGKQEGVDHIAELTGEQEEGEGDARCGVGCCGIRRVGSGKGAGGERHWGKWLCGASD